MKAIGEPEAAGMRLMLLRFGTPRGAESSMDASVGGSRVMGMLCIACFSASLASLGWANEKPVTSWLEISPSGACVLNQEAIRCDHVARRLRAMDVSPESRVVVIVDGAPYEAVAGTLDSLKENEIKFHIFPPALGTNPPKWAKRWIRLTVYGAINHPFAMAMISTENFRTWREKLVVLGPAEFTDVDRLTKERIAVGDCANPDKPPPNVFSEEEQLLLLFDHDGDSTQACLLPREQLSCEFLSGLVNQGTVNWVRADPQPIRAVAGEIGCEIAF